MNDTAAGQENPQSKTPDPRRPTPDGRYCVQRKTLYALLHTMKNHQPKRRPRTAASRKNPQSKSASVVVVVVVVATRESRLCRQKVPSAPTQGP